MRIDKGSPSEYKVSGIMKRIKTLDAIKPIKFEKALDFGMGRGAYYNELKEYGKSLFGMDVNIDYLKEYQNFNNVNYNHVVQCTGENVSFKGKSFDSIFLIEVLEHVDKLDDTVEELSRIVNENGLVYLTIPNNFFPLESHNVHFGRWEFHGKFFPFICSIGFIHQLIGTARRFTIKKLNKVFLKSSFVNIGYTYIFPPLDNSDGLKKVIGPILMEMEKSFLKILGQTIVAVYQKTNISNNI